MDKISGEARKNKAAMGWAMLDQQRIAGRLEEHATPPKLRWIICGLLFAATAINYMDRQILGILAIPLQKDFGWTESQYGLIITSFQIAYATGLLIFGPFIDWIGTRIGYAVSVGVWSLSATAHGLVGTVAGFGGVRALLGLGEAGNFPAAIKAISEYFPDGERALAVGIFNSGSTVGAIVTPLIVPWIALAMGWRAAFFITGLLGLLWIPLWLIGARRSTRSISGNIVGDQIRLSQLLSYRETWVFLAARALTEPVWWFYLFWAPKFLNASRGITLTHVGLPLTAMYALANAGGLFGGWLSSWFLKRGWSFNRARKCAVFACAFLVVPVAVDAKVHSPWAAIAILGLAMGGHQGWASNLFAMFSDIYPTSAVASVTGITGVGAAVAGAFAAAVTGLILQKTGSYQPILTWASVSYMVVLAGIQVFVPRLHRIEINPVS
jgi:ACS family hexuronate transporter-like MFS transporter